MSNLAKKLFVISLTVTTIAWAMGGILVAQPALAVSEGDLIKTATSSAVYYVGADNKKYVFPDEKVYFSWYENFDTVQTVSQDTLQSYTTTANVVARAGTKLVQFVAIGADGLIVVDDPKVYAVEPNGVRRWITTADIAEELYGADWEMMIYPVPNTLISNYTDGTDITDATYPEGSLVKTEGSSTIYYINGAGEKQPLTDTGFSANMFQDQYVITASDLSGYVDGSSITAEDTTLTNVAQTGAGVSVGTGLTVAKASDSPAAASIISDANGSQGQIPLLKLNFTAASDGAVTVDEIKLKRVGINATADFTAVYLYDADDNWVASYTSITTDYITFSNSAGLFTVPAGTTAAYTVKFDLTADVAAGKTFGLKVATSSDITTNGASVNGSFPMEGNLMSVALVTDFAILSAASVTDAATINPSVNTQDLWTFSLQAQNQDVMFERTLITNIGSVSNTDVQDLMLYADGAQIGTTVANLGSANTVLFSDLNYLIEKGDTKNFTLKGTIMGGSSKTFKFSQQNSYDITAVDQNYNVNVVCDDGNDATWTVNEASQSTTVNSGSLSVNLSSNSITGYMAGGLTNQKIATYEFTAVGEAIKVKTLYGTVTTNTGSLGMDNVKLIYDGTQVGVTADTNATEATVTSWTNLGSAFIVPEGETKELVIKGDTKSAAGTDYSAGETFYFTINGTAGSAQAVGSLTSISVSPSIDANTITISSSAPTIAKNTDIADYTIDNPTGVKNEDDVLVASFFIIGGTAEPIDVTSIRIDDVNTTGVELGDMFYNLQLYNANTGIQIGSTQANLNPTTSADTYTFTPASAIRVGKSEILQLDVKADVKSTSTALTTPTAIAKLGQVIYNKVDSGGSTTWSTGVNGHNDVILTSGTLTVTDPDSQVFANLVAMGDTVELAKFKAIVKYEDMNLEKIVFNNTIDKSQVTTTSNATSSLINYTLWDGSEQIGTYGVASATATPVEGAYITFNISPAYLLEEGIHTLTLKAVVNSLSSSAAGSTDTITLRTTWSGQSTEYGVETVRGESSNTAITGVPSATVTGNAMIVVRAYPIVTLEEWTDKTLTNGNTETLYKWKVTASHSSGIKLKKMMLETSMVDTTTSTALTFDDFKLYRNNIQLTPNSSGSGDFVIYDGTGTAAADRLDTGGTATMFPGYITASNPPTDSLTSATGTIVILFDNEESVGTDGNIYELKARVQNVSTVSTDSDSITTRLLGADDTAMYGSTPTSKGAYYLDPLSQLTGPNGFVAGAYWAMNLNTADASAGTEKVAEFIWSDYSKDTSHGSINLQTTGDPVADTTSSMDWFNGYKVRTSATQSSYLPLDSVPLTK